LLSVAQQVTANGPHWQNGITWQTRCLVPMGRSTYDECIVVTGSGGPPPEPSATETVLDSAVFNQPPPPPVDDVPLLVGAEPPAGRHGARSAARAASKAKQDRHGLSMWVPLAAVLCVGVIVFSLFKLVPSIGSKSAGSSPSSPQRSPIRN
jgi:hypothetical protein